MSARAVAFGSAPWWLVAVALGGQGHYAAAATELARLLVDPRVPGAVAAHAAVTRAADRLARGPPSWRLPVRAGWVRAELALVGGLAAEAVEPAERSLDAQTTPLPERRNDRPVAPRATRRADDTPQPRR